MADLTIFQLTQILPGAVDQTNDLLPIWDNSDTETKKITVADFKTLVAGAVNWSESFSSTTQATSRWTPNNAAANVNAAITPKGTGALVAQIPDGTTVGGNARGSYAVDFQMQRTNANQVSSGNNSVICGGAANLNADSSSFIGSGADIQIAASSINFNSIVGGVTQRITAGIGGRNFIGGGEAQTINGTFRNSIIGGGASNTIGASYTGIFSGQSNTNNATHSVIIGGIGNTISGYYHTVSGYYNTISGVCYTCNIFGENNTATANGVTILGASSSAAADGSVVFGYQANGGLFQQVTHAGGRFSANGDAQAHELIWRREITGSVQTELFLNGASVRAILPGTNCVWQGIIDISAICTNAGGGSTVVGDVEATSYKVTIKRIGTNTVLVGTVQEIGTTNADVSMSTGVFTIDNDNTNESLRIQYTPPTTVSATTVIRVLATFRGTQIQY